MKYQTLNCRIEFRKSCLFSGYVVKISPTIFIYLYLYLQYSLAYACLKLVNYSFFFWLPFYLSNNFGWKEAQADRLSVWYDVGGIIGKWNRLFISCFYLGSSSDGMVWVFYVWSLDVCVFFLHELLFHSTVQKHAGLLETQSVSQTAHLQALSAF